MNYNKDIEAHLQALGVVSSTWVDDLSLYIGYEESRDAVKRWHSTLFNHETMEPLF